MKHFTIYDPTTGRILRSGICGDLDVEAQVFSGESVLEVPANPDTDYVVEGGVAPMPARPSEYHEFNWSSKVWEFTQASATRQAADTKLRLTSAVQSHLDAVAQSVGYDNIYTACTYADEPSVPKFQLEGRALRAWRSDVWAYCWVVLADVESNARGVPTSEQLVSELPVFVLPT